MKINCAIIDDTTEDIQNIQQTIGKITLPRNYIVYCDSYSSADELLSKEQIYDLYIIDIEMPGMNGFDLARRIYQYDRKAVIIFCTMFAEFIFDSYKYNAYYFVRKTNLEEDLAYALQKFENRLYESKKIYVMHRKGETETILFSDIIYFEVVRNSLYIHLQNGTEKNERKTLKAAFDDLHDPRFIVIGKSFIVNCDYITAFKDYNIVLTTGFRISVPKASYHRKVTEYLQYMSR